MLNILTSVKYVTVRSTTNRWWQNE